MDGYSFKRLKEYTMNTKKLLMIMALIVTVHGSMSAAMGGKSDETFTDGSLVVVGRGESDETSTDGSLVVVGRGGHPEFEVAVKAVERAQDTDLIGTVRHKPFRAAELALGATATGIKTVGGVVVGGARGGAAVVVKFTEEVEKTGHEAGGHTLGTVVIALDNTLTGNNLSGETGAMRGAKSLAERHQEKREAEEKKLLDRICRVSGFGANDDPARREATLVIQSHRRGTLARRDAAARREDSDGASVEEGVNPSDERCTLS
jgi:hypothetical protein